VQRGSLTGSSRAAKILQEICTASSAYLGVDFADLLFEHQIRKRGGYLKQNSGWESVKGYGILFNSWWEAVKGYGMMFK